jgi:hypothetical protein
MIFDLTGLLPASPVRKDGCKGSYTKMAVFLTGKLRPEGREGFTQKRCPLTALRCASLFEQRALVNYFMLPFTFVQNKSLALLNLLSTLIKT